MDNNLHEFLTNTYLKLKVFDNHDLKFNIHKDSSVFLKTTDLLYFIENQLITHNIEIPIVTEENNASTLDEHNIDGINGLF
jgi:hypothetical protein